MKEINSKIKKGVNILFDGGFSSLVKKSKSNNNILTPVEQLSPLSFKNGYIDIIIENDLEINDNLFQSNNLKYKYNIFYLGKDVNSYTLENVFVDRSFIYIYKNKKCDLPYAFNLFFTEDVDEYVDELSKSYDGLKLFANYDTSNTISVKTSTFFDYMGTNYYSGGAERYLLDLYDVCNELGINLIIYQHGKIPFIRKYNNINVIGLCSGKNIDYSYDFIDKQTKKYIYHTYNNSQLHIYSSFQECYPNHIGPSIGISHGISWDNKNNHYSYGKDFFWENKKIFLDGASYCNKLISVDTNTCNWFQTVDFDLGNKKFHYIPNYVNVDEFYPRNDYLKKHKKIVITYPRRLYEPRGLYIVLDIVDDILKQFKNVEFHFVGKGFDEDTKNIDKFIAKYPNRIKRYSLPPEKMYEEYKNTDISLIPTQYSEGTSLSCLEAMASGNLVIASRIGGLTDLVINAYNGYLIEPSSDSLRDTLLNVLENFNDQYQIRQNAVSVAKSFNKILWRKKWINEISAFHLKNNSTNNELVEFYLTSLDDLNSNDLNFIKKELLLNNLIYLRLPNIENIESFGLLQIVSYDEEVVSSPARIYKKSSINISNRKCDKIIDL